MLVDVCQAFEFEKKNVRKREEQVKIVTICFCLYNFNQAKVVKKKQLPYRAN